MVNRFFLLILFMFFTATANASLVTVSNVRVWAGPESTRIVFDLSAPITYKAFVLTEPHRLVVDLDGATLAKDSLDENLFKQAGMRGVRHAARNPTDYRVVFDLNKPLKPSTFQISPSHMYGQRLVIDLLESDAVKAPSVLSASVAKETVAASPLSASAPAPTVPADAAASVVSSRPFVVMIDPGHGGEDPGAIGQGGSYEKNIVLGFSRKLQKLLNQREGVVAHLTRTGDYFIPLATRTRIAREKQADLFISIHTDGARNSKAKGSSVYALSHRGATSETAKWLAQRENASDLVGGVSLDDKEDTLAYVLLDLSQSASLDASLFLGKKVLSELGKVNDLHSKKVEQAGFMVLRSPDIPSILVELGYITNPVEERRLNTGTYQDKLVASIVAGIGEFHAQRGTHRYLAMTTNAPPPPPQRYTVARGDTLDRIARKHNISSADLKQMNGLTGDLIRVGATLLIP